MATLSVPSSYATIAAAITAASNGDTIQVAAGTYTENITINKQLTIQGADKATTTISSVSSATIPTIQLTDGATGTTISNLTVKCRVTTLSTSGAGNSNNNDSGIYFYTTNTATNPYISNITLTNLIVQNSSNGIAFNNKNSNNITISNCIIQNNEGSGIRIATNTEVMNGFTVDSCTIQNNNLNAINSNPNGTYRPSCTNYTIQSCTISNNNKLTVNNSHDVSIFGFNGIIEVKDTTITSNHAESKSSNGSSATTGGWGFIIYGSNSSSTIRDSGTIILSNLTFNGNVIKSGLGIERYANLTLSVNNVNLKDYVQNKANQTWAQVVMGHNPSISGTVVDLKNTKLTSLQLSGAGSVDIRKCSFYKQDGTLLDFRYNSTDLALLNSLIYENQDLSALGKAIGTLVSDFIPVVGSFNISNQILSYVNYTITNPSKPSEHTGTWSYQSSNTNIANVSGNVITFRASGSVTITATLSSTDIYNSIELTSIFNISSSNSPSTLNFNNIVNVAETYFSSFTPTNDIVLIPSDLITSIVSVLNPTSETATVEEKQEYRSTLVKNLFNYFSTAEIISVPPNAIYLPTEIDTTGVTNIQLINTTSSSSTSPTIATNIASTDVFYALLESVGNSIKFNGIDNYAGYSIQITKSSSSDYTVIKKNSSNIESQTPAVKGSVINWAGFNIVIGSATVQLSNVPVISICFPAGTPVVTDQGIIAIEKINSTKNTIRGKKIVAITKTVTIEDKIICIEKDALGSNIPSQNTLISRNHKLFYNKQMIKAKHLVGYVDGVFNKKYNGEILYNVLLETYEKMIVNNLIVETLDPKNIVAQLYNGNYTDEEKNSIIVNINQCAKYKKAYGKV
jgi:hypothetical protein